MSDDVDALRARLSGQDGAGRVRALIELAQALTNRYWRTGPGSPAGVPDLSGAIDALSDAYSYLDPGDAYRATAAGQLGWLLGARHLVHGSPEDDAGRAVPLLEEALAYTYLPPTMRAMAGIVLGQLYFSRVARNMHTTMLATPGSGSAGVRSADLDRAIACFQTVLAGESLSEDITTMARTMLRMAEAMRTMMGGVGQGLGGFDLGAMMQAAETLRTLQHEASTGGMGVGGFTPPPVFSSEAFASLDLLDRPVTFVVGARDAAPSAPPTGDDRKPVVEDGDRGPVVAADLRGPVVGADLRRPVVADDGASRVALRDRITELGTDPDVYAAAAALLSRGGPGLGLDAVAELAGLAVTVVHSDGAEAADRFALAVALCLRGRLDTGGWDDDSGDLSAGAESLAAALETMLPTDPAAVRVMGSLGAFLDDRDPLGGVLETLGDRFAAAADAILATGCDDAVVRALAELCHGDVVALDATLAAVPENYPWSPPLRAAARSGAPFRAMIGAPLAEVTAALRAIDADLLTAPYGDRMLTLSADGSMSIVDRLPVRARVLVASARPVPLPGDVTASYVDSGAQVVRLALCKPLPANADPVFVANPRGDRESATVDAVMLRRMFYPRSTGLGRTVEQVDGEGTRAEVLSRLSASILQLGCGVGDAGLELAGPTVLDAATIASRVTDRTTGGLAILPPQAGADRMPLADALLQGGCTGVVGWLRPLPDAVASLVLFMLHTHLVDDAMPAADAVHAVNRWTADPDRVVPPHLPAMHAETLRTADLSGPVLWLRGR